ncbi:MAG: protein-L-isoaspartate(D-aspartate) O-methyltransferase [Gammaproteobacteria bacterium]|nr:protein-L-isoaspartate(D-aspartate) O-methyltransferase [Gammaproteobacteria bacterium]
MNRPDLQGYGMTSLRSRERLVAQLQQMGIRHSGVLEAIKTVPRHLFMDEALSSRAYENSALPIGLGQTISQPYIVARMSEVVVADNPDKVLEIGTGCGYQTAILATLCREVLTIERIRSLYERARSNLRQVGVRNAYQRFGDGYEGWERYAPFDAIVVTAAPSTIPQTLLQQLTEGGRLVLPVGGTEEQQLLAITRRGDEFEEQWLEAVKFVPMLGGTAV